MVLIEILALKMSRDTTSHRLNLTLFMPDAVNLIHAPQILEWRQGNNRSFIIVQRCQHSQAKW